MNPRWGLLCIAAAGLAWGFEDPCAKFGLVPATGGGGYAWRKNRCEGIFTRSVAGALDLRLVSFAGGLSQADPTTVPAFRLTWNAPNGLPVQLRAVSLRNRHYYRMDAAIEGQATFEWPTEVLRSERLTGAEVGIVAIAEEPALKDTYVPLTVQGAKDAPELRLLPGTELGEVTYSIDQLAPNGKVRAAIAPKKELGLGFYPAGRSFRIQLPADLKEGYYRLSVSASAKPSGTVVKDFVIYWPKAQ